LKNLAAPGGARRHERLPPRAAIRHWEGVMKTALRNVVAAIICGLYVATLAAQPQNYPERAVRFIVPSAPGGAPDISSRIVAAELTRQMGKQFVIDNRPGASGSIGTDLIARAAPDGYTIGQGNFSTLGTIRSLLKLPYDTDRDLQMIGQYSFSCKYSRSHSPVARQVSAGAY
jgi:tripartite-type tricarboxylate transporter receptor subunit TctC